IHLPRQQRLPLLGVLTVGNVDGDAADPRNAVIDADACRGRADAPSQLPAGAAYAKFGLVRLPAFGDVLPRQVQPLPVLGMDQRPDAVRGDVELPRIDSEDTALAFIPRARAAKRIPFP